MRTRSASLVSLARRARARAFVAVIALIALSTLSGLASPAARAATIVVVPVADDAALTSEVRGALAAYGDVQAPAKTAESLAAAKELGIACTMTSPSCLAELGGLAGGELVVGGSAIPMPEGTQLVLRLVQVATGKLVRTSEQLVPPSGPARARALRILAVRLVAPEKERGSITVFAPAGAALLLDGAPVGNAPLKQPLDVAPGKHEVYGALNGYISAYASVDVDIGQNATVTLELPRDADGNGEPDVGGRAARHNEPRIDREGRIGLIAVEGSGFDQRTRTAIADTVAYEMQKLDDHVVVTLDDVENMLPPQTAVMLACREAGCHALVAKELNLEDVVVVEVDIAPEETSFTLSRYDGTTGHLLKESVHDGLKPDGGDEIAPFIAPALQELFPRIHVRADTVRGVEQLIHRGKRPPLPAWLFWTSLAATGATAATAGGLATWSAVDPRNTPGTVDLAMWVAVGATVALIAADVAVALSTDWER